MLIFFDFQKVFCHDFFKKREKNSAVAEGSLV